MKLVITNDDGIDAPGLEALAQCVRPLGDVVIVAPQNPQSGIAHRVTTHEFCGLDTHPHNYVYHQTGNEFTYKGTIHERPRDPGKDVAVCFDEGRIAITRLAVGTGTGELQ